MQSLHEETRVGRKADWWGVFMEKLLEYLLSKAGEFEEIANHHEDKKEAEKARNYADVYFSVIEYITSQKK